MSEPLPACGERSDRAAIRVRGPCHESERVERPPHPDPLPDRSRVYPTSALEEGSKSATADFDCGERQKKGGGDFEIRGRGGTVDATDLKSIECARGNPGRRTAQSRGNLSDGNPEPSPKGKV